MTTVEDLNKSLAENVEVLLGQVCASNAKLSYERLSQNGEKFGDNIGLLLTFEGQINSLVKAIQIEFFAAMQILDKLNKTLCANKKGKDEKENEKNKKKKEVKLL